MKLNPYIMFTDGNCRNALSFYETALGGRTVSSMTFAEAPGDAPVGAEWGDMVMHAQFEAAGISLFACDSPPEYQETAAGISLTLTVDTPQEAERMFAALSDGANVTMPIDETIWASRFGMLTDRYGISWMVSCDKAMA